MSEPFLSFLKQGLMIGLAVAVPVGPTSVFCIQRAITKGMISGFISSAGAATANAIQAALGAFGLSLVASRLSDHEGWFNFVGGIFLCYLGLKIFLSHFSAVDPTTTCSSRKLNSGNTLLADYGAALLLTSINPLTILPFIAFFTQIYSETNYPNHIWAEAGSPIR